MGALVTSGLLVLLAAGAAEPRPQAPTGDARGRDLLAAGDSLGAAEAFREALRASGRSRFTVQLAVYCDVSNLDRQVRASGNPPELFVLRRSVGGRTCLGVYWGLFASRAEALAGVSTIPGALRATGQAPVAVSAVLPPGDSLPSRVVTTPPPPVEVPVPAPEAVAAPAAEVIAVTPAPPSAEPMAEPLLGEPSPAPTPEAPSLRVPAMEVEAGYSYLEDDTLPGGSFALGGVLSGCASVTRALGVVGEASGHYTTEDALDDLGGRPLEMDLGLLGVHAGLRYTHRHGGFVTPYVQALAGVTRTSVELAGRREVEDDFSIQPGAGVVFRISEGVGVAVGADYRLVFAEDAERNELRIHTGLVFGFGRR
jgi:hypothetical protein